MTRLVSFTRDGGSGAGVLLGQEIVELTELDAPADSVKGLLGALDRQGLAALGARAAETDRRIALSDVALLAPVVDPQKIICLGLNYRDHAAESGQQAPAAPMWFAKFANSLIGSGQAIVLPDAHADHVDYEAELAIVIGASANNVSAERALEHVAGAMPVQRCQRPRSAVPEPAVDQRQGARHVRPLRPRAGHPR